MLDFKGISVHYGHQDLLTDVTFRVNKGELVIENSPRIGWTRQNPEPDTPSATIESGL